MPAKANRLIRERSPYLLQHAHNPVEWYPWGEEAFEKAKQEDKPVFLSIGYSTCHWCHVMAHESFEDPDVARLMNEVFVSIKVDREERPDVDSVYMKACQLLTGSGGWPLTIIMTPEKKPFFAGTYFPKRGRLGRMGMLELIPRIGQIWKERREELEASAARITEGLRPPEATGGKGEIGEEEIEQAHGELLNSFDDLYGGFGVSPKFPTPHNLLFLLRYWKRSGSQKALDMVEKTLGFMRRGGIFDQLGFGFHRYSTDREWLVPHFEKMLYDQALLAITYLEAYQATKKEEYARAAREIFEYVTRDLLADEGAFHSAEDADSQGVEGKFYLWRVDEVVNVLGSEKGGVAAQVLGMAPEGNLPDGEGQNVLHLSSSLSVAARRLGLSEEELSTQMEEVRIRLLEARSRRPRPRKDDKILADWNGLMIAALAKGMALLGEGRYLEAATEAAEFVLKSMRTDDGRLLHRYREGEAAIEGKLDDYSFMIWGLIELYQASFDPKFLRVALELKDQLLHHFWDGKGGGFFLTSDEDEELLFRQKETHDGALPSGNSVAMMDLLLLARITGLPEMEDLAVDVASASKEAVAASPSSHTMLLAAVGIALGPDQEVVIAGRREAEKTGRMLGVVRAVFAPNMVVLLLPAGEEEIVHLAPFLKEYRPSSGDTLAYLCADHACMRPTSDVEELRRLLRS